MAIPENVKQHFNREVRNGREENLERATREKANPGFTQTCLSLASFASFAVEVFYA